MNRERWEEYFSDTWRTDGKWKVYGTIAASVVDRKGDKAANLLDAGCGVGAFLDRMKAIDGLVSVGIDWSKTAVDLCSMRKIKAFVGDIRRLDGLDGAFDFVVATDVLDAVEDPAEVLAVLCDHLEPGGTLIVSCSDCERDYEPERTLNADDLCLFCERVGLKPEVTREVKTGAGTHFIVCAVK